MKQYTALCEHSWLFTDDRFAGTSVAQDLRPVAAKVAILVVWAVGGLRGIL